MTRSIAIRADASAAIGGGHVMRCLALATELARRGAQVRFLCREATLPHAPLLAAASFDVIEVDSDSRNWCVAITDWRRQGVDVVVVDSYAAAAPEETVLRDVARRIVVIDDLADRAHDCDLLIDQNLGRTAEDYAGLVPSACTVLAGPRYALLRPEFAAARPSALARRAQTDRVQRILVSMGMTDVGGITQRVVRAVLAAETGARLDVVLGSRAPSLPALRALAAERPDISLHIDSADMCALMVAADLAVGAAGTTSWERCCLGLPAIVLVLADNQFAGARALVAKGAAVLSSCEEADCGVLTRHVHHLATCHADTRREMSRRAAEIVDGQGMRRAAAQMCGISVRRTVHSDSRLVLQWRNDPETRRMSRQNGEITRGDHETWYAHALGDRRRVLLMVEVDGAPSAVVRFDRLAAAVPGRTARMLASINVAPELRGKGLGAMILGGACDYLLADSGAVDICAEISDRNSASARIFESCGFRRVSGPDQAGFTNWLYSAQPLVRHNDGEG